MPLLRGKSKKVQESNFHELRHGKQFSRTARKFGKKKAEDQMVAIVLNESRKDPRKRKFY